MGWYEWCGDADGWYEWSCDAYLTEQNSNICISLLVFIYISNQKLQPFFILKNFHGIQVFV